MHFFWGAPDLAVTRFSGRPAPEHPGGVPNLPDRVTREAYSHEVSSCGFWPGGGAVRLPRVLFLRVSGAGRVSRRRRSGRRQRSTASDLREFILPYDAVRRRRRPDDTLLEFLQSTYEAAARLAGWDRPALERVG